MYAIAVFKSRRETLDFLKKLELNNIKCSVINTPRIASRSCGLSVKFDYYYQNLAKNILMNSNYDTYVGLYQIIDNRVSRLN